MKQKAVSCLLILAAIMTMTPTIPTFAAETNADETQEISKVGSEASTIKYDQASSFVVTIPKTIALSSDKKANFNVNVKGDITGDEIIMVIPDQTVLLRDANGKTDVTGQITQMKTEFTCDEIAVEDGSTTTGDITANDLTAGDWSGNFDFRINTNKIGNQIALSNSNLSTYGINTTGDVVIPEYVTDEDNTRHTVTSISDYTFRNCSEMTSATIADTVTEIGTGAFVNCSKLSSVSIPTTVKVLGDSVFDGCDSLTSISYNGNEYDTSEIESAMTENGVTIGTGTFEHAYNEPVYVWTDDKSSCTATRICSECNKKETETVNTTSNITKQATCTNTGVLTYTATFENAAFKTQTANEAIAINGVHVFDNGVCTECGLFTAWTESGINVATNYTNSNYATAATSPAYVFTNRYPNAKIISIPSGIANIGNYAFVGCTKLTNITIPNSVTTIGNASFSGCNGMKQLTLSSNTKTIKDWAFANCTSLTNLVIPNSVTTIGGAGFYNCSGVSSVTLSNNITSIGNQAFINCYSLSSVTYKGVTYTSKSALQAALSASRVSVGYNAFDNTSLK